LLLVDTRGECGAAEQLSGYYFREARFLRTLRLEINGRSPWSCEACLLEPHVLAFTYVYPELTEFGGGGSGQSGDDVSTDAEGIPHRALSLRATYALRANTPQLWNASAFPLLIHSMLGFQPAALLDTLFVDPVLPTWLPELVVHDLRLAGATVTLRFWRDSSGSSHGEVLHRRGTFRLVRQPPLESLTAGVVDRLAALIDSVRH
jgi:hypothetical protein